MRLTPDGKKYLAMGAGQRVPLPFHLRWLLPFVCRQSELAWIVACWLGIAAFGAGTGWLAWQAGATLAQSVLAAVLVWGLPSVRFASGAPVLVDMPALAVAVGAAAILPLSAPAAIALACVAGAMSEKAPIVAALAAWSPWLLLGLIPPALRLLMKHGEVAPGDPLEDTMRRPFRAGWSAHRGAWRHPALVLPWGVCLLALWSPSLPVGAALLFGYALLLLATDTVRLYQQAAPVLAISAALLVPDHLVPLAAIVHWFNPWAGNGV